MRLWSIHPRFMDTKGLLADWREGLLAQKSLAGLTRGYKNHPQLNRFKAMPDPMAAIGCFLVSIVAESKHRGYRFDGSKILVPDKTVAINVTQGQLEYEWGHFLKKIKVRDPNRYETFKDIAPDTHPIFRVVPGEVERWEIL